MPACLLGHDVSLSLRAPPHAAPRFPCSREVGLSPEQGGGDIVAAVFFQLIVGGVHLKIFVFL